MPIIDPVTFDLDLFEDQLEGFRRKALGDTPAAPPASSGARHSAPQAPTRPSRPKRAEESPFKRLSAKRHAVADRLRLEEPVWTPEEAAALAAPRDVPETLPAPVSYSAPPPPPVAPAKELPPAPRLRTQRSIENLDPKMARLVGDLLRRPVRAAEPPSRPAASDPVPAAPSSTSTWGEPEQSVSPPTAPARSTGRPRVLPPASDEQEPRVLTESEWAERYRTLVASGTPTSDAGDFETAEVLDHCRERAYRHDDLEWRAALSLLLARLGKTDEARRELTTTSSKARQSGVRGSWIDIQSTLSQTAAVLDRGGIAPPSPSSSSSVGHHAPAPSPSPSPAEHDGYRSRWTSWEKVG